MVQTWRLSHTTLPITRPTWIGFLITLVHDNGHWDSLQICQILPHKAPMWLHYTFCSNKYIYCHYSPTWWTVSSSCVWIRHESCLLQSDSSIWPTCCSYHRVTHLVSPRVHDTYDVHILLYLLQFLPKILSYSICKLKRFRELVMPFLNSSSPRKSSSMRITEVPCNINMKHYAARLCLSKVCQASSINKSVRSEDLNTEHDIFWDVIPHSLVRGWTASSGYRQQQQAPL